MPTQWRTIAPIVGRTATQCLQRYQKLLDEAEAKENDDLGLGGPEGGETQAPSADDIRRLRPGEEDPDPENKPALPDTVDMDEDEKEMLSEARARLANTKGKKAKRKARERQLEESRRLALLQKRRELKSAGINIKITNRKPGQMDYNADIPFEKAPAPGFYDTQEEQVDNERSREAFDPRRQQLANKRKQESQNDQEDDGRKRRKNDKSSSNAAAAAVRAGQMQKMREAERQSKRGILNLPAPQVSEGELESIVKMGMEGQKQVSKESFGNEESPSGLVGDYSNTITNTPIRTPMVQQEDDRVANEVRNARLRTETQSALLGGDNPDLDEGERTTGYEGVTPSKATTATPNPMATPLQQVNGESLNRPGPSATPMRTPRDSFRLNDQTPQQTPGQTPVQFKQAQKAAKSSLSAKLGALPRPKQTDFELELPDDQVEPSAESRSRQVQDAALRDAQAAAVKAEMERREFKRQTQVVKRQLPIPQSSSPQAIIDAMGDVEDPSIMAIAREAAVLTANDAQKFGGANPTGRDQAQFERFDDHEIAGARMEIALELQTSSGSKDDNIGAIYDSWETIHGGDVPEHGLGSHFEQVEDSMTETAINANAVEKKLAKHLGGYQARSKTLRGKVSEAASALQKARVDLETGYVAQLSEEAALNDRLRSQREEVQAVLKRERAAQETYGRLQQELEQLSMVNGHS